MNPRILVVEDNDDVRRFLGVLLAKGGYDFLLAGDGYDALCVLKDAVENDISIDGIVLDIMMPKMNGIEFIKQLKDDFRIAAIPIIVLTAYPERKVEGVEAVLEKPVDNKVLLSVVKRICGASVR